MHVYPAEVRSHLLPLRHCRFSCDLLRSLPLLSLFILMINVLISNFALIVIISPLFLQTDT